MTFSHEKRKTGTYNILYYIGINFWKKTLITNPVKPSVNRLSLYLILSVSRPHASSPLPLPLPLPYAAAGRGATAPSGWYTLGDGARRVAVAVAHLPQRFLLLTSLPLASSPVLFLSPSLPYEAYSGILPSLPCHGAGVSLGQPNPRQGIRVGAGERTTTVILFMLWFCC